MNAKVLLVMPPPRRENLLRLLEESGLEVYLAGSFQEARRKLSGAQSYDLLCVDAELQDGSWKEVLQSALDSRKTCETLVCSRCGDERLWAEVIQCGAYDLIPEPYDEREIARIIQSALDSHYMRRFAAPVAARSS